MFIKLDQERSKYGASDNSRPYLHNVSTGFERQAIKPELAWNPENNAKSLLESFTVSVQERLMADVLIGIVLSGGLSSSSLQQLQVKQQHVKGNPFQLAGPSPKVKDNPDWLAAEDVAASLNLVHHQKIMSEDSFVKDIPKLSWHGEDLDVSVLFFQPLFEQMRKRVKVGLCGQGADEIHAGYPRYKSLQEHRKLVLGRLQSIDESISSTVINRNLPVDSCYYSSSLPPRRLYIRPTKHAKF